MKTIKTAVVVLALVGFFVLSASAQFGGLLQKGTHLAVEKEINKNLKQKNCTFKPKVLETNCDWKGMLDTLKNQKAFFEKSGLANNVYVHCNIGEGKDPKNLYLGDQRENLVDTQLINKIGYWDTMPHRVPGDGLECWVKLD